MKKPDIKTVNKLAEIAYAQTKDGGLKNDGFAVAWAHAVNAALEVVDDLLQPLEFDPQSPMMMTILCHMLGREMARLAHDQNHMYGGLEVNMALVSSAAGLAWAKREKAANAIRVDN